MAARTIRLGGIRVPCTEVSDDRKSALVRHEYAGHDGADLEHLGWGPVEHKLRAIFPASRASDWESIKELLKTGAKAVFEHFELGEFDVQIESVSSRRDRRIGTVEVDFTVVEDGIDQRPRNVRPSAVDVVTGLAQAMANQAIARTAELILPAAMPAPDLEDNMWLEKLGDLGSKLNALVRDIQSALGRIDGVIAAISYPVSAAYNALAFGADLPSQLSARIAKALDLMQGKVAGAPDPAASASRFLRDVDALLATFQGSSTHSTVRILGALQGARTVAAVMATDEDRLRAMQASEASQPFDERGRWMVGSTSTLARPASVSQMAALVGQARTLLQSVRPLVDDGHLVDRIAVALQEQYNDRLFELEQVVEIEVQDPTPLHLICHRQGLPYNTAERLVLLNPQIKNPTFVQGRVLVYAA